MIRSTALVNQDRDTADAIATLGTLYRDIVKREISFRLRASWNSLQKYLEIMGLSIPSVLLSSECRAGATAYPYREILDATFG